MKIYTKTGDQGYTSLANGQRVKKSVCNIEQLGVLDELNADLGVAITAIKKRDYLAQQIAADLKLLKTAQDNIFFFGSVVAKSLKLNRLSASDFSGQTTLELEEAIDDHTKNLPPLTNFILPGGSLPAAHLHRARVSCRRAERVLVDDLMAEYPSIMQYLNRLSDYLFTLARVSNKLLVVDDVIWKGEYVSRIRSKDNSA